MNEEAVAFPLSEWRWPFNAAWQRSEEYQASRRGKAATKVPLTLPSPF